MLGQLDTDVLFLRPVMVLAQVLALAAFAAPVSKFRPASCGSAFEALRRIGLPLSRIRAFRQGMAVQWDDHLHRVANGEAITEKGQLPCAKRKHHSRWNDSRAVIADAVPEESGGLKALLVQTCFFTSSIVY